MSFTLSIRYAVPCWCDQHFSCFNSILNQVQDDRFVAIHQLNDFTYPSSKP